MNEKVEPNLKSFLDEYELFIDEYVELMKKYYKNPTDVALLTEYTDVLQHYNLFTEKPEKYDTEDISTADLSALLKSIKKRIFI